MRRLRRGGVSGLEFASSGEDSFVAVVVTKLTGALLFILLLAMVIMALLPKAVDLDAGHEATAETDSKQAPGPLQITTPANLPDAVAGRPYIIALAATGARGALHWSAAPTLPAWLGLDEATGQITGTPPAQNDRPLAISLQVSDGTDRASRTTHLLVLPASAPALAGAWWKPHWAAVPWRAWFEHGVGFLVIWLVHLLGMNLLTNLEHHSIHEDLLAQGPDGELAANRRFAAYRAMVRVATLSATIALALWLVFSKPGH